MMKSFLTCSLFCVFGSFFLFGAICYNETRKNYLTLKTKREGKLDGSPLRDRF